MKRREIVSKAWSQERAQLQKVGKIDIVSIFEADFTFCFVCLMNET